MSDLTILISHITEEKELALELKQIIEGQLDGAVEAVLLSDDADEKNSSKWLSSGTNALAECSVMLILCSPQSIKRPWISFEAGAGWGKGVPVMTVCHSGMTLKELPPPLDQLQGTDATNVSGISNILYVLSIELGSTTTTPSDKVQGFIEAAKKLESSYIFWNKFNESCKKLKAVDEKMYDYIGRYSKIKFNCLNYDISKLVEAMEYFEEEGLMKLTILPSIVLAEEGEIRECEVDINPEMVRYMESSKYKC